MNEPITIQLSAPIQAHGESLSALTLDAPTIGIISKIGSPFLVVNTPSGSGVEIIPARIVDYASKLGKVPPSSLAALGMEDYNRIQEAVMGFFGGDSTATG